MNLYQLPPEDPLTKLAALSGFNYTFLFHIPARVKGDEVNDLIDTFTRFFKERDLVDSKTPNGDYIWGLTAFRVAFSIRDPKIAMQFKLEFCQ